MFKAGSHLLKFTPSFLMAPLIARESIEIIFTDAKCISYIMYGEDAENLREGFYLYD